MVKMVSEFLTGKLGEHSLFPECLGGEAAIGLGEDIEDHFGKVAPGDIVAPGRGVAAVNTCHQQLHGHGGLGVRGKQTSVESHHPVTFKESVGCASIVPPGVSLHRTMKSLAGMMAPWMAQWLPPWNT